MKIASPKAVRNRLAEYSQRPHEQATKGDLGALVGQFEDALEDVQSAVEEVERRRYLVWGFCFGQEAQPLVMIRSQSLSSGQIFALKKWVGWTKEDDGGWTTRETFLAEVRQIFNLTSMLYMLDKKGDEMTLGEWLNSLEERTYEVEPSGMVQSAVDDMGGVITANVTEEQVEGTYEPSGGYIPL